MLWPSRWAERRHGGRGDHAGRVQTLRQRPHEGRFFPALGPQPVVEWQDDQARAPLRMKPSSRAARRRPPAHAHQRRVSEWEVRRQLGVGKGGRGAGHYRAGRSRIPHSPQDGPVRNAFPASRTAALSAKAATGSADVLQSALQKRVAPVALPSPSPSEPRSRCLCTLGEAARRPRKSRLANLTRQSQTPPAMHQPPCPRPGLHY